jgi:general secretion pathway protein M
MEQLKALLSELQSRFQQLSARERRLVTFAGSALAVFVLFLVLFSFSSSAASYRRRTEEKLTKLK